MSVLEPHELFSQVSGLEVTAGTEAEILSQIRRYQKTQAVKSARGREEAAEEAADNFEFCWEESRDLTRTPGRDIPGHARPKPAKSPRSSWSSKSDNARSPKTSECSKSPRSPVSDIVGLADDDLRKLKLSIISDSRSVLPALAKSSYLYIYSPSENIEPRKPTSIKFSDSSEFQTVDPDVKHEN